MGAHFKWGNGNVVQGTSDSRSGPRPIIPEWDEYDSFIHRFEASLNLPDYCQQRSPFFELHWLIFLEHEFNPQKMNTNFQKNIALYLIKNIYFYFYYKQVTICFFLCSYRLI